MIGELTLHANNKNYKFNIQHDNEFGYLKFRNIINKYKYIICISQVNLSDGGSIYDLVDTANYKYQKDKTLDIKSTKIIEFKHRTIAKIFCGTNNDKYKKYDISNRHVYHKKKRQ